MVTFEVCETVMDGVQTWHAEIVIVREAGESSTVFRGQKYKTNGPAEHELATAKAVLKIVFAKAAIEHPLIEPAPKGKIRR